MFTTLTLSAHEETFRLQVGPGPEDIVQSTLPGSRREVVTTALARRRPWRQDLAVRGFRHVVLQDGRPVVLNDAPDVPEVKGYAGAWQGLSWQPQCSRTADGGGMLAATRARSFIHGKWMDVGGAVDLFVWSRADRTPRLQWHSCPAVLKAAKMNFSFNAVALARDGTLYASVMSFAPGRGDPVTRTQFEPWQESRKIVHGAVYVLTPRSARWALAADNIPGANGLHLSADEKTLFVNSAASGSVLALTRDPRTGVLSYSGHHRFKLHASAAPDNLRMDSAGRLHATGTQFNLATAAYLISNGLFGTSFGLGPRGVTWTWEHPLDPADIPMVRKWPAGYRGPSTALRFGEWWIISQMVDDDLLCVRDKR